MGCVIRQTRSKVPLYVLIVIREGYIDVSVERLWRKKIGTSQQTAQVLNKERPFSFKISIREREIPCDVTYMWNLKNTTSECNKKKKEADGENGEQMERTNWCYH